MTEHLPPPPDDLNALPPGTRFGELEIQCLLGAGGFGIVYLAKDHALERLVAIKEYMPGQLAQRGQNSEVSVRSGSMRETFELGLRSFVNEARLLARFDHRSLLKVYRFWEANNTAYMAMPYLQGQTLKQWREARGRAPEGEWLLKLLRPLMEALGDLHAASVYHRDIAPDNIFLPADGSDPILLDFGAARRAIGDHTQSFTAILKPSYAPLEQYDGANALKQGPWTDLYALGAVLYHLIAGHPPPAATRRALADEYQPLAGRELPGYPLAMLMTIDWALALRPQERPQSIGEFREALLGQREIPRRALPGPAAPATAVAGAVSGAVSGAESADDATVIAAVTVPTVQPAYEATQLLAPLNKRFDAELTAPLTTPAPALAATVALPATAPALGATAAPVATAKPPAGGWPVPPGGARTAKPLPWLPIGLLAIAGLLLALWLVLRGPAGGELAVPADAASAASSASAAAASSSATSALPSEPVPALAAGESFVEPALAAASAPASAASSTPSSSAVSTKLLRPSLPAIRGAAASMPAPAPGRSEPRRSAGGAIVVQEPAPAPLQQPAQQASLPRALAAPDQPGAADPRVACGGRVFIALTMCVDRKCTEPAHAQHAECVRLREIREQRER